MYNVYINIHQHSTMSAVAWASIQSNNRKPSRPNTPVCLFLCDLISVTKRFVYFSENSI
jgi:hypothetical protein